MSASLGFANTYALAVRGAQAERLGLRTIGDLAPHPDLSAAFSSGFLEREDGWPGLKRHYGLGLTPRLRDGARAHVSRAGRGPGRRHGRLLDGRAARAPAASPPRGRPAVLSRLLRGAAGAQGDRRAVSPHVDPAPRGARGADRRPPHGPAQRHGRSGRQARARGGGGLPRHGLPFDSRWPRDGEGDRRPHARPSDPRADSRRCGHPPGRADGRARRAIPESRTARAVGHRHAADDSRAGAPHVHDSPLRDRQGAGAGRPVSSTHCFRSPGARMPG